MTRPQPTVDGMRGRAEGGLFISPSILPDCVLPGDGEMRGIVPHLDETQINQLCQMLLVDHPGSFGGNVLQRPSQVDGIRAKIGEWVCLVFHPTSLPS